MNPLLLNFIFLTILALICYFYNLRNKTTKATKVFIIISFISIVILRAFVNIEYLPDLPAYNEGFQNILNIKFIDVATSNIGIKSDELGFRYSLKILGGISNSFTFFLLIFGLVWTYLYYKTIKEYSPFIMVSILFLLIGPFNQSIFVLRQHMAMAIVLISYKFIINGDLKKFLFTILLAFSFHYTAIVAIPMYFIYAIKNNKNLVFLLITTAIITSIFTPILLNYFGREVFQDYSVYIDSEKKTNASGFILFAIVLLFYCFFLRKNIFNEGINRLLFINITIGVILLGSGIGFNPTGRLAMYYSSIGFLAIPKTIEYINNKLTRYTCLLSYMMLYLYINFYGSAYQFISEYSFLHYR